MNFLAEALLELIQVVVVAGDEMAAPKACCQSDSFDSLSSTLQGGVDEGFVYALNGEILPSGLLDP